MNINLTIFVILFCLMSVFGIVLAWSEPINISNKSSALTSSTYDQKKDGDLGVYTLYDIDNDDYFLNPNGALSLKMAGGFILEDSNLACVEENEGILKFSKKDGALYLCDGSDWLIYYQIKINK